MNADDEALISRSISPNLRAALIHALGDSLLSASVLVGAVFLRLYPTCFWIDPLCTLLSAAFILIGSVPLLLEIVRVLMEASPLTPSELAQLKTALTGIKGVLQVDDLHVWTLGHSKTCLNAKVSINSIAGMQIVLDQCKQEIQKMHPSVKHVSLQPVVK